jgi:hypothetical protein
MPMFYKDISSFGLHPEQQVLFLWVVALKLILSIMLYLIFAAVGVLLKLVLIYYVIALVLLGLFWAFYENALGWYVLLGAALIMIVFKVTTTTSRKTKF